MGGFFGFEFSELVEGCYVSVGRGLGFEVLGGGFRVFKFFVYEGFLF